MSDLGRVAMAGVAGFLATRLAWGASRPVFAVLSRANHRGHLATTSSGLVLPVALVVVESGRAVAGALGIGDRPGAVPAARLLTVMAVFGFGLLGAIDDLLGDPSGPRGFRGHLGAIARGRLTTGGVKLVGGLALALVLAGPAQLAEPLRVVAAAGRAAGRIGLGTLVGDAALIAGCANLANLLDRRPGRTIKVATAGFVLLVLATGADRALIGPAIVIGGGLALFGGDLHEHHMLGDSGANVLGAILGLGLVMTTGGTARLLVLAVVVALNLVSEIVSYTSVIEAVPPLRALDRVGRRPDDWEPTG
ncbi:MAG: hypothetical protein ACYDAD_05580 [Acidimicrobiales bacterium]